MIPKYAIVSGLAWVIFCLAQPLTPPLVLAADGVKTYYKQYSIFTHENEDYLCEPYLVQKDEWLYKIFRQKGEISAADFPKFLKIFQQINPRLNNIDAIAPGIQILIPLKRVHKLAYEQKTKGIVEVPVIEFSLAPEEKNLAAFIHKHTIQSGDTVSTLLGKEFLEKGGAISQEGRKAFGLLNPDVKNIDRIYLGSQVLIPNPDILSQPWFNTFLSQGSPKTNWPAPKSLEPISPLPILSPRDLVQLKRYAQLIQGTLMHQGQMYFPGKTGGKSRILDLSKTPILEEKDGKKTLILPDDTSATALNQTLLEGIKDYWKEIQIQEVNKIISQSSLYRSALFSPKKPAMDDIPKAQEPLIDTLLSITPYSYTSKREVPFTMGSLEMSTAFGRIIHESKPDLLVNLGTVYGLALETLEKQGYTILTFSPDLTTGEVILLLFTRLGYTTWKNPSFTEAGRVNTLQGMYVNLEAEKYFFAREQPPASAMNFIETEKIKLMVLGEINP